LSLQLLLDEDSQDKILTKLLRTAGHDVLTINEANFSGAADDEVLALARQQSRVLLTHNCGDFLALHKANPCHSGILAVYRDANPRNKMGYHAILKAINNIEKAMLPLSDQFVNLNQWRH
jgi:uncharacterized protein with PIN domain